MYYAAFIILIPYLLESQAAKTVKIFPCMEISSKTGKKFLDLHPAKDGGAQAVKIGSFSFQDCLPLFFPMKILLKAIFHDGSFLSREASNTLVFP
jgi:hypothetical protein